jgi:hypothetical protein
MLDLKFFPHRIAGAVSFASHSILFNTGFLRALATCFFLLLLISRPCFGQACVTPDNSIVAWWNGDGNAFDSVGGDTGSLQGGVTFASGEVSSAFSFDGVSGYVSVSPESALDVGSGNGFTFECWINPADVSRTHMIGEWNNGSGILGVQICHSDPGIGGLGAFFANIVDTSGGDHIVSTSPNVVVSGVFQHIAVTYDKVTSTAKLYYNGALLVSQNIGSINPQTTFPMNFGARVSGPSAVGSFFSGLMDEISLYNRALADSEIQNIYNAGMVGKCESGAPQILIQPSNQQVHIGGTAAFNVGATGSALQFQWLFNNVPLPSATNYNLTISNVQSNQAGGYSVVVTNASGSITSLVAVLTVDVTCISAAPGLVSLWKGDGDASDSFFGNAGTIHGAIGFAPGEAGQAFNFNGTNGYISIAPSPSMDVGAGDGLTIECWLKPTNLSSSHAIAEWNNGAGGLGVQFWHSDPGIGGPGSMFANLVGTNGANHILASPANIVTTNAFQHVAITYNRTNGIAKIYRNGLVVSSQTLGSFRPQTTFPLNFGARVSGAPGNGFYLGLMDEVALYNRALDDGEISAIYNSGTLGKSCSPPQILNSPQSFRVKPGTNITFNVTARGNAPMAYQWRLNGFALAGATNSSLTLTNVQPGMAGNYSVLITNSLGSITSSNAALKVDVVFAFGNSLLLTNSSASFNGSVSIRLTNVYPSGLTFYTLDGSTPSFMSAQYSSPFSVTNNTILRALGYSSDFFQSAELDPISILIVPNYSLVVTNTFGGTVALNPAGSIYLSNTIVTLTATPSSGWTFLQWLGDGAGTNAAINITMSRSKFVQAVFGTTLSTTAAGGGSVTLNPPGGLYPYGTVVLLSAIPQAGNFFGIWGNAGSGNANPLSFTVSNANPVVSSLFSTVGGGQAALSVVPIGSGTISVNPRANIYTVGQSVNVTATPSAGQKFLGWTGDASGSQNPLPLVMNQSKLIYANFSHGATLSVSNRYDGLKPEGFVMTITGDNGGRYQVEASSNLVQWSPLGMVTNYYGTADFEDYSASVLSRSFYRAVLLP